MKTYRYYIFVFALLVSQTISQAQVFGGHLISKKRIIPANITLAQNRMYFVASVYDQNYLPYSEPTVAATATTPSDPDSVVEATTINVQGSITTTGVTVKIPVVATGSGTLPAFTSSSVTIPANMTEDGISRDIVLSWASQAYTTATKTITATIAAVGDTLNAKKLDINAGVGNDYMGVLMGSLTYPYNNAGATTTFNVYDIAVIPDKIFGQYDIGNTTTYEHNFLYVPVQAEDNNIWLNNNLGASYTNINCADFNPNQQATANNDWKAYGSLFQWGRCPDGHELITWTSSSAGTEKYGLTGTQSSTNTPTNALFIYFVGDWRSTNNNILWATKASENNPCPYGFRVPTSSEFTTWATAANVTNSSTAVNSVLGLSLNGFRASSVSGISSEGRYWSSTINTQYARYFGILSISDVVRYGGYAVRCIKDNSPAGVISSLNCAGATNNGTLSYGTTASGVTSVIAYTGGNGGVYAHQSIASTGVTGLTATLESNYFATGSGSLTYTITGAPNSSGTASFVINIGGQSCTLTRTVNAFSMPSSITLGQNRKYFVASVYDQNYFPYSAPTVAATATTPSNPDSVVEATTINVQGSITTTGVTVKIPVTATASSTLPAFTSSSITIPANMTEDGISRDVVLSWASQAYTTATKTITATIAAVGGTLNAKKLDINTGVGNDYLGVLMGSFTYPYNNAGTTTTFEVRDIAGVLDGMFGVADNSGSTTNHNMLYVPVQGENDSIWLNNNLGAHYADLNSAYFNPNQQATAYNDWKAYGSHFQWGRKSDGHELITWTSSTAGTYKYSTTTVKSDDPINTLFISNSSEPGDWRVTQIDTLWAKNGSVNNPCPINFRVADSSEFTTLISNAGLTNYTTAASSMLKFSCGGFRFWNGGALNSVQTNGRYWTNKRSMPTTTYSDVFSINSSSAVIFAERRANGLTVRCIKK